MIGSMGRIYEAWYRELGAAEYRLTITMSGYGHDENAADTLLDGFLEKHPDTGPVVSQDRAAGTISVTFSLQASSQDHALKLGQVVWAESGAASGLKPTHVVRLEIEPIEASAGGSVDRFRDRVRAYSRPSLGTNALVSWFLKARCFVYQGALRSRL